MDNETVLSSDLSGVEIEFETEPPRQTSMEELERALAKAAQPEPTPTLTQTPQPVTYTQTATYQPEDEEDFFADPEKEKKKKKAPKEESFTNDEPKKFDINKYKWFLVAGALVLVVLIIIVGPKVKKALATKQEPEPEDLSYVDPIADSFVYYQDEWEELRKVGYSADEIENAQSMHIPAQDLIDSATAERDAWWNEPGNNTNVEQVEVVLDDTLKQQLADTWYGLPIRQDIENFRDLGSYYEVQRNLDFEKIEVHGSQLFIKVYLSSDKSNYFFALITPEQYFQLPDSGNILCTYTYATALVTGEDGSLYEDNDNIFIISYTFTIIDN